LELDKSDIYVAQYMAVLTPIEVQQQKLHLAAKNV
jgi:hypothetical protein